MDLNSLLKKLPHKFPMLMLDKVIGADDKTAVTRSIIKTSNPFTKKDNTLSEIRVYRVNGPDSSGTGRFFLRELRSKDPFHGISIGIKTL